MCVLELVDADNKTHLFFIIHITLVNRRVKNKDKEITQNVEMVIFFTQFYHKEFEYVQNDCKMIKHKQFYKSKQIYTSNVTTQNSFDHHYRKKALAKLE